MVLKWEGQRISDEALLDGISKTEIEILQDFAEAQRTPIYDPEHLKLGDYIAEQKMKVDDSGPSKVVDKYSDPQIDERFKDTLHKPTGVSRGRRQGKIK